MMLMPEAPAPGSTKPVNGLARDGADGGNWPVCRVEEEHVARPHLDRQRAPVEAALERGDLERDAVVVDAEAAVHTERPVPFAQLKPSRGPKLFLSAVRSPW